MEKATAHIFVSGRVQGVFFRASAKERAQSLGLAGWARNLADGKVELVAEGEKGKLDEFIEWCKEGSQMAQVTDVDVSFEDAQGGFREFEVLESQ